MSLHEFDIIQNFFTKKKFSNPHIILGIGDDAAITTVPAGQQLVITTDTLISGVHFPVDTNPYDIGYKALAVNLSDLAAMGATPAWVTLALTLPNADESWLQSFANGFFDVANRYHVALIGGDLTHAPLLSITVQAHGFIPHGLALRRNGAKPGDIIYVSNTLGDAGLALQNKIVPPEISCKLNRPEPQILLGEKLRGIASSAIDISDGLAADLSHILQQSQAGAEVNIDALPISDNMLNIISRPAAVELALSAGDDYELCFTVPENKIAQLKEALTGFTYTEIGKMTDTNELKLYDAKGKPYALKTKGYQHF